MQEQSKTMAGTLKYKVKVFLGGVVLLMLTLGLSFQIMAYDAEMTVVYPNEIDDILHNPDMGWVLIDNALPGHIDCGRTGTYPEWDNVAVLSCWSELEPEEGVYNWTLVDQAINYWSGLGKRIHFRISTDAMIISGDYGYVGGVPEWLFTEYNVPYQEREDQNLTFKLADYTNPVYKEKLSNFLTAWADRYKNNPNLDLVDLMAYGTWGEWHSGHDFNSYQERETALKDLIDRWYSAWEGKKYLSLSNSYEWRPEMVPQVAFPQNYEDYVKWSAFDYALTKPMISWNRNGIGGALWGHDTKFILNVWNKNRNIPIKTEFFMAYDMYKRPGGFNGYTADSALDEALSYHPNYITNMGFDGDNNAVQFYNERPDLTAKGNKLMGYRFVLTKASYPQQISQGEAFTLKQTWVNRAVGRCYKKWPLKIYLTDVNGNTVWSAVDNSFDQTSFINGEVYDVASHFTLPEDIPQGTYDLRIAMVDAAGEPKIKLAISGKDASTRYKIGTITVANAMESFEAGAFSASHYKVGVDGGEVTSDLSKRVSGTFSAYGQAPASKEWYNFLYSDSSKIKLEGKATYSVTFKYKCLMEPDPGGYYYFLARTDSGGIPHDKSFTQWSEAAGSDIRSKTITVTTDDYDDYYLIWGLNHGGAMAVDEIQVKKIKGAYGENFESGSFSTTNYMPGGSGGSISNQSVSGMYSAYGNVALTEWYEFLKTDKAKFPLQGNTVYEVTFGYKVNTVPEEGGYFTFLARTDQGGFSHDKGVITWLASSGKTGTKTIRFVTDNFDDYYLTWAMHWGGEISIDNIKVTKVENSVWDTFEGGTFASSNYTAGVAGGSVTNGSGSVLNGTYSVYASMTSGDWYEFLYSDRSKIPLAPNTTYRVTFRTKACGDVGPGGFYYFLVRTTFGGIANDKGFTQWMDKNGTDPVTRTIIFKTGNYSDYYMIWGIHNIGAVSVDEIILNQE